jgi:hypothetical protein
MREFIPKEENTDILLILVIQDSRVIATVVDDRNIDRRVPGSGINSGRGL